MENLYFADYEDLAFDIMSKFDIIRENDEYNDVAIIAKYEDARQIIKELLCLGYDLRSISIHDELFDDYNAEYVISLLDVDGEGEVWCEPMLRENGYLEEESTIIYVLDNCSSKVLPHCDGKILFEVSVGEYDCDECCGCCECDNEVSIESDGDMHGFSVNHSDENGSCHYSFYSTDMDLVEKMAWLFR